MPWKITEVLKQIFSQVGTANIDVIVCEETVSCPQKKTSQNV